ncbi:MAG: PDZ domain-containing protein [Myxococcota bacterium]
MSKRPLQLALVLGLAAGLAAWVAPRLERGASTDACAPAGLPPADAPVAVCGTVSGGEGAAEGAITVACFGDRDPSKGMPVDAHGRFQGWLPAESCRLTAFRADGDLIDPGTGTQIHGAPGDAVEVDLWVPNTPAAGMGFGLDADINGIYIRRVHPNTPASRAGLASGDRIVTIDGVSTVGMTMWEFIERGVGSPGTQVVVDVRTLRGEQRVVSMRRQVLPKR